MNRNKDLQISRWPRAAYQPPPKARVPLFPGLHSELVLGSQITPAWVAEACRSCGYHEHAPTCSANPAVASKPSRAAAVGERDGWMAADGRCWSGCRHFKNAPGIHVFPYGNPQKSYVASRKRCGDYDDRLDGPDTLITGSLLECQLHVESLAQPQAAGEAECPEARKAGLPAGWLRYAKHNSFRRTDGKAGVWGFSGQWFMGGIDPQCDLGKTDLFPGRGIGLGFATAAVAARYADEQIAAKERA